MFHNTQVFALANPQPAWMVTWRQTSRPPLRSVASSTGTNYTHMDAVISAATGRMLEIFPSP